MTERGGRRQMGGETESKELFLNQLWMRLIGMESIFQLNFSTIGTEFGSEELTCLSVDRRTAGGINALTSTFDGRRRRTKIRFQRSIAARRRSTREFLFRRRFSMLVVHRRRTSLPGIAARWPSFANTSRRLLLNQRGRRSIRRGTETKERSAANIFDDECLRSTCFGGALGRVRR